MPFFTRKASITTIMLPIFLIWFAIVVIDLGLGHKYQLAGKFNIVWGASSERLGKSLRYVWAVYVKYRWFLPILVFIYAISPFLALAYIGYDAATLVFWLVKRGAVEADAMAARATTTRPVRQKGTAYRPKTTYRTPVYNDDVGIKVVDKADVTEVEDSDTEEITPTFVTTGKFPVHWSADQVRAFRRVHPDDKPDVTEAVSEFTPDGATLIAVHFQCDDGRWARPAEESSVEK